jgi:hypothetical protein
MTFDTIAWAVLIAVAGLLLLGVVWTRWLDK